MATTVNRRETKGAPAGWETRPALLIGGLRRPADPRFYTMNRKYTSTTAPMMMR